MYTEEATDQTGQLPYEIFWKKSKTLDWAPVLKCIVAICMHRSICQFGVENLMPFSLTKVSPFSPHTIVRDVSLREKK